MTESGSSSDPAAALEREADQLEHHLEQLGDHITDAQKTAAARREEAMPEQAAGDWEDTKGTPGQGEDPEGAVSDDTARASGEAPSEDDATASADGAPSGDAASEDAAASSGDDSASEDAPAASGDDSASDAAPERDDPVGSRMPGHASGGDD
jgi:hypothetical protein